MHSRFSLVDDLRLVPDGASFSMLLRHAERGDLKDGEMGADVMLTEKGLSDARDFGEAMKGTGISAAFSSPVPRCVATAREILIGAGHGEKEIVQRKKLGDYGIYVTDKMAAYKAFTQYGNAGVIERYIADGGLDGFMPMTQGSRLFLSDVFDDLKVEGSHNVYLSHDMILMPLISHFTGEQFGKEKWLDCLDGFLMMKSGDEIRVIRKGIIYKSLL